MACARACSKSRRFWLIMSRTLARVLLADLKVGVMEQASGSNYARYTYVLCSITVVAL